MMFAIVLQCWMTVKRQVGSTSMEMFSDSRQTRICFVLLLAQALRYADSLLLSGYIQRYMWFLDLGSNM